MATRITFPTGQKADFIAEVTKHREHLERGVRECNETLKRLGIPVTLSRAVQLGQPRIASLASRCDYARTDTAGLMHAFLTGEGILHDGERVGLDAELREAVRAYYARQDKRAGKKEG